MQISQNIADHSSTAIYSVQRYDFSETTLLNGSHEAMTYLNVTTAKQNTTPFAHYECTGTFGQMKDFLQTVIKSVKSVRACYRLVQKPGEYQAARRRKKTNKGEYHSDNLVFPTNLNIRRALKSAAVVIPN